MADMLRDKDEIREQIHRYCVYMDSGRFEELGDLFTPEGEWITPYAHVRGPAEVAAVMARNVPPSPKRVHMTLNTIIDVSGDRATARSNYLVMLEGPAGPVPSICGIYDDIFRRTAAGWRFQRRLLIHLFRGDLGLNIQR
jgi:hypothetical protein